MSRRTAAPVLLATAGSDAGPPASTVAEIMASAPVVLEAAPPVPPSPPLPPVPPLPPAPPAAPQDTAPKPPPPHLVLQANIQILAAGEMIYDAPWDLKVPMGAAPECLVESGQTLEGFLENVSRQARVAFNRYVTLHAPKKPVARGAGKLGKVLAAPLEAEVLSDDSPEQAAAMADLLNTMPMAMADLDAVPVVPAADGGADEEEQTPQ